VGGEVDDSRLLAPEALRELFGKGEVVTIGEEREQAHFLKCKE
jgi:hypothetical protein